MGLPKTILMATDFSASAKHAQREAAQLAQHLGAQLYVMHSWRLPQMASLEGGWVLTEDVFSKIEDSEHAALVEALQEARSTLPSAEGKFVQGDPRDCILQAAQTLHADMIVLGTHGRSGVSRLLLGSVAEYIVRHASCPVLVIRAPEQLA